MSAILPNVTLLIGTTNPSLSLALFLEVNLTWKNCKLGGIQNEPTRIWRSHVRSHSQPHHPGTDPWNASSSPGPYYLRLSSSQPRDPILNPSRSLCGPVTLQQPVPTNNKLLTKAVISLKLLGKKQRSSQGSSKLTSVAVGQVIRSMLLVLHKDCFLGCVERRAQGFGDVAKERKGRLGPGVGLRYLRALSTMDHEVVPRPCKICDWLLNSSRDPFGQIDHEVRGSHDTCFKAYIIH